MGLLACLAGAGCAEDPSFYMRWQIAEDVEGLEDAPDLDSAFDCSSHGISRVRVTTLDPEGFRIDRRSYACFPPQFRTGDAAPGPELEPGEYTILVEGLRATGEIWDCTPPEPPFERCEGAEGPCTACVVGEVTIEEGDGARPRLNDLPLLAPTACDDGIDNDDDGKVDDADLACLADPDGPEDADKGQTLFDLEVEFLDTPAVGCNDVGVEQLLLRSDGARVDPVPCSTNVTPFALPLAAGDHELEVTGGTASGNNAAKAWSLDDSSGEFTDVTADLNNLAVGPLFADGADQNDQLFVAFDRPFAGIELALAPSDAPPAEGGEVAFQYWAGDDDGWRDLPDLEDESESLTADRTVVIDWGFPSDWEARTIEDDTEPLFYMRMRVQDAYAVEPSSGQARLGAGQMTDSVTLAFNVVSDEGSFVADTVRFGGGDFLEPVVSAAVFDVQFEPFDGAAPRRCSDAIYDSALVIDEVQLKIRDVDSGTFLDAAASGLPGATDIDPETIAIPCPNAIQKTAELTWGAYEVEVAGVSAGAACFEFEEAVSLVPGNDGVVLLLPRILEERTFDPCDGGDPVTLDAPPPACADCDHCGDVEDQCGGLLSCAFEVCGDD